MNVKEEESNLSNRIVSTGVDIAPKVEISSESSENVAPTEDVNVDHAQQVPVTQSTYVPRGNNGNANQTPIANGVANVEHKPINNEYLDIPNGATIAESGKGAGDAIFKNIVANNVASCNENTNSTSTFVTGRKTFPSKLFEILTHDEFSSIISWMQHGRSWKVHDQGQFEKNIMPQFFQQTKFASFARQVTGWGFKRITANGPDRNSYFHELFLRDNPGLLLKMKRPVKKRLDIMPKPGDPNFYQESSYMGIPGMHTGSLPQYQFLGQDPQQMLALHGGAGLYHPQFNGMFGISPANQQVLAGVGAADPRYNGTLNSMNHGSGGLSSSPYGAFGGANLMMQGGIPMLDGNMMQNRYGNIPLAGNHQMPIMQMNEAPMGVEEVDVPSTHVETALKESDSV